MRIIEIVEPCCLKTTWKKGYTWYNSNIILYCIHNSQSAPWVIRFDTISQILLLTLICCASRVLGRVSKHTVLYSQCLCFVADVVCGARTELSPPFVELLSITCTYFGCSNNILVAAHNSTVVARKDAAATLILTSQPCPVFRVVFQKMGKGLAYMLLALNQPTAVTR